MTCMERSDQNVQNNKNIVWQQMTITRKKRAESLQQVPKTIWLTGLSGAGKSTLINEMDKRLFIDLLTGNITCNEEGNYRIEEQKWPSPPYQIVYSHEQNSTHSVFMRVCEAWQPH